MLRDDESVRNARQLLSVMNMLCLPRNSTDVAPTYRTHPMASETDVRLVACVELMSHKGEFHPGNCAEQSADCTLI